MQNASACRRRNLRNKKEKKNVQGGGKRTWHGGDDGLLAVLLRRRWQLGLRTAGQAVFSLSPPFGSLSLYSSRGLFFFSSPVLLFSPLFIEPWRDFDVEPRSGSRSVCRGAAGLPRLRPRGGLSAIVSVGGPPAWGLCRLVRGTCKKNKKIQSFLLPRCNVRGEEDSEQCRSKRHRSVPFFLLFFFIFFIYA